MYQKRNNEFEVVSLYLGDYTRRYFLREIARETKLPLKNVQRALNSLEDKKIFHSKLDGKNKYFSLNLDNVLSKLYLLHAELQKTQRFLEAYPLCKPFLKSLSHTPIIVFGSFARFAAGKHSDFDMLIISEEEPALHLLPYKIHPLRMKEKTFIKAVLRQETLIKEIEQNHIILNNHSFYVEHLWRHYAK